MGTSSSVDQFVGKIRKTGVEIQKAQQSTVAAAAKVLQAGAQTSIFAAAPGGHLRNVKGSHITVISTVKGTGGETTATIRATSGAAAILDNRTRAHLVGAGRSTKKVKRGLSGPARPGKATQVLKIGGQFVTGPIHHPGTKGKHTFNKGIEASLKPATEVLQKKTINVVKAVYS